MLNIMCRYWGAYSNIYEDDVDDVVLIAAILRNEVGWFDKAENSMELLSMRSANVAT
jgi:hypothetical protein